MGKKKIYAVKKGKSTGLFSSWEECRTSVEGYPGAEFKGFAAEEEARAYLEGCASPAGEELSVAEPVETARPSPAAEPAESVRPSPSAGEPGGLLTAYVDGSFDARLGRYSFGCVLLLPSGEILRRSGSGDNPESAALRNVTGEMLGAMYAVRWCAKNGYPALKLCYDYMGIEMWAVGGWRAKTELTQKYALFMQEYGKKLAITFQKIAAHTGDRYNEEADRLAKAALTETKGIPPV